jgi:hypothetical protein
MPRVFSDSSSADPGSRCVDVGSQLPLGLLPRIANSVAPSPLPATMPNVNLGGTVLTLNQVIRGNQQLFRQLENCLSTGGRPRPYKGANALTGSHDPPDMGQK